MKYDLSSCIGSRVRRISRIIDQHYRRRIKEFGISENQLTILMALYKMGKVEQGKLGNFLVIERSAISRNIRLLEKDNLVMRSAEYRPSVSITRKGQNLVEATIPHWEQAMDELIEKLGEEGYDQISKLESRLK